MAVKGLDIFKLSPKKNCKECGSPTCMAFCMKVAQGAVPITKCPYMSEEAVALLSEATAPPMKTIEVGTHKLGGETVMMRHEKTLVNRNLFAATLATDMDDAAIDARIEGIKKVDYERIGEREMVECVFVHDAGDSAKFVELCKKAAALPDRTVIIDTKDVDTAKAAVEAIKDNKPILNGANKDNFAAMSEIAKAAGLVLGVSGKDLSELHDTVAELEKAGNKNLILDVTAPTIKETFANAVLVRRTAIKDGDRTFGYPSIVNLGVLCDHNEHLETALASMFVVKYGSIIVMDKIGYAEALPLYRELSREVRTAEGAESAYRVIEATLGGGDAAAAETLIFAFAEKGSPHAYWVAKAYIALGDIYAGRDDSFQARATYQSIVDGYSPADDGIVAEAKARIEKLKK